MQCFGSLQSGYISLANNCNSLFDEMETIRVEAALRESLPVPRIFAFVVVDATRRGRLQTLANKGGSVPLWAFVLIVYFAFSSFLVAMPDGSRRARVE